MKLAYRPPEAAEALGVNIRTIYRWLRSGVLRSHCVGSVRLIPASEVERVADGAPVEGQPRQAPPLSAEAREIIRRARRGA